MKPAEYMATYVGPDLIDFLRGATGTTQTVIYDFGQGESVACRIRYRKLTRRQRAEVDPGEVVTLVKLTG